MKKTIIIAAIVSLMIGCTKEEIETRNFTTKADTSEIVPNTGDKVYEVQPLNPDNTEIKGGTIQITIDCVTIIDSENISWTGFGRDANGSMWSLESRLVYNPKLGRKTFKVFAKRYTSSVWPC